MRNGNVYRVNETLNIGRALIDDLELVRAPMRLVTPPLTFNFQSPELGVLRKILDSVELRIQHEGDVALRLKIVADDGQTSKTLDFVVDTGDKLTPDGSDTDAYILGESPLALAQFFDVRRRAGISGVNFTFELFEPTEGEGTANSSGSFTILKFNVYYRVTGQRGRSDA